MYCMFAPFVTGFAVRRESGITSYAASATIWEANQCLRTHISTEACRAVMLDRGMVATQFARLWN